MELKKAIEILETSSGMVLPDEAGSPILYPSLNRDEEDFLTLQWDDDGEEVAIHFEATDNAEVEVQGSSLVFKDVDGQSCTITPLFPMDLTKL